MDSRLAKEAIQLNMAAVVGIVDRCGLFIDVYHRNQLITISYHYNISCQFLNSCSKQLYIRNKTEYFTYKGGCVACGYKQHIEAFKTRAGLVYKWLSVISNVMLLKTIMPFYV